MKVLRNNESTQETISIGILCAPKDVSKILVFKFTSIAKTEVTHVKGMLTTIYGYCHITMFTLSRNQATFLHVAIQKFCRAKKLHCGMKEFTVKQSLYILRLNLSIFSYLYAFSFGHVFTITNR